MSVAGYSVHVESERQAAIAAEHRRAADEAEHTSTPYRIATTEANVARRLTALSAVGHHLLPDRA